MIELACAASSRGGDPVQEEDAERFTPVELTPHCISKLATPMPRPLVLVRWSVTCGCRLRIDAPKASRPCLQSGDAPRSSVSMM